MARITDLLARRRTLSVELWPPRTPDAAERLAASLERLRALSPDFASITYGAAGSTRDRTHEVVVAIHDAGVMTPMAHLTCAAHRRDELVEILLRYRGAGIENILALRGDPPLAAEGPLPAGELAHAAELVELVRELGGFDVAVAAHPTVHPESPDAASDLDHLAHKLGRADFAITQLFFEVGDYLRLVEGLSERGVDKPVVAGIMPVTTLRSLEMMTKLSGAEVPDAFATRVARAGTSPEDVRAVGVELASELAARLLAEGVPGLHFYTMNETRATLEVCANLGLTGGGGR